MTSSAGGVPPSSHRRARLTVRARLTAVYTALVVVVTTVLVGIVYVVVGAAPHYSIAAAHALAVLPRASVPVATDPAAAMPASPAPGVSASPAPGVPANPTSSAPGSPAAVAPGTVLGDTAAPEARTADAPSVPRQTALAWLIAASLAVLIVLGCVGAWVGWIITGRLLQPLQSLNRAARKAAAGALDHRLALPGPNDELKELADTFDQMLDQLERSFNAHRRFAADASHELQTPLATTQAILDVALADPDGHTVTELATTLRATNKRSLDTVEALLDLADLAHRTVPMSPVHLGPLIEDAVSTVADEAADRRVSLDICSSSAVVNGDELLLGQLLQNLMQNAVRHNLDGGRVTLRVSEHRQYTSLRITNDGERIAEAVLPSLTKPFYRGSGRASVAGRGGVVCRSRGLGLALAQTIAEAHGATLDLAAIPDGGMIVEVRFTVRAA